MNRILCSVGAVVGRPNGRNIALLNDCIDKLSCDGFEFMMYSTWHEQLDQVRSFMKALPVPVPVFHAEKGIGEYISRNEPGDTEAAVSAFRVNCALARDIGAQTVVLHLWNGVHSDKDIAHNFAVYEDLRRISDEYGLVLAVENVVCSHRDPMTHMKSLIGLYPDISFTFDTKMAQFHGQLDQLYLPENEEIFRHVRHMHINDYAGGYMDWKSLRTLHMGEGKVDYDMLFRFVLDKGYAGDFTVEATSFGSDGIIDFDALNRDFARIRGYLGRKDGQRIR